MESVEQITFQQYSVAVLREKKTNKQAHQTVPIPVDCFTVFRSGFSCGGF